MEPILLESCENRNSDLQRTGPSIFHHTALTLHLVWPEARAGVSRLASSHQSQHPGRLAGWPAGSNDSGPSLQSHYTPCRRLRLLTLQRQYPLLLVLFSSYFDLSSPPCPLQRRSPESGQLDPYSWKNLLLTKPSEDGCPRPAVPVNRPAEEPRTYSTDAGYSVPVSREGADLARPATARTPASEDRLTTMVKSMRLHEAGPATTAQAGGCVPSYSYRAPGCRQWPQPHGLCWSDAAR